MRTPAQVPPPGQGSCSVPVAERAAERTLFGETKSCGNLAKWESSIAEITLSQLAAGVVQELLEAAALGLQMTLQGAWRSVQLPGQVGDVAASLGQQTGQCLLAAVQERGVSSLAEKAFGLFVEQLQKRRIGLLQW